MSPRWKRPPKVEPSQAALTSLGFVWGCAVVAALLTVVWTVTATRDSFTDPPAFHTWVGLCALTLGIWVVAFCAGLNHQHAFTRTAKSGTAVDHDDHVWRMSWLYAGVGLLVLAILGLLWVLGDKDGGYEPALAGWWAWRVVIPGLGLVAAAPWIVTVWWTHDELSKLRESIRAPEPGTKVDDLVVRLRGSWASIERCTIALAVVVTTGTISTGALRLAIQADTETPRKQVPPPDSVLVYGLFFAALVAVVVVPLLLFYRRRAQDLVDALYPPASRIAGTEEMDRLRDVLHLTAGPLRDPWALLGVLTPVVTGALAAYLPGLA